ncbi:MAG: 16S rRNA (cytosine(1402)-N(4))-methyltransferase RsmH, partial [Clostridia bacterium]|nr:16S rRNA (cytosine(1402)-N(4))-methyltransferase RsmH [Clostridia bacterium]
ASRGFSYIHDAPLDMRMNRLEGLSAADVVNTYSMEKLTDIFYSYGEEKWSKRIAEFICNHRENEPIKTTGDLVEIIEKAIPKAARADGGHPAKRVFQAVRIEVNGELRILEAALRDFTELLNPGGRLAVITFHSLEDRIVKNTFKDLCTDCVCPREFPVCVCNHRAVAKPFHKKPILPSKKELDENSRSRSAKLRIIEKL